jgi:hypothetical protein
MFEKTFILGVGCQKGGTSWINGLLNLSEHYNPGFTKEFHIWDALTIPCCAPHKVNWFSYLRSKKLRDQYALQSNTDLYFSYFNSLFDDDHSLTSDMTPSYSGLSSFTLLHIKEKMAQLGIRTKIVFIMRDPFERCWSAVRMNMQRRSAVESVDIRSDESQALEKYYCSSDAIIRTRYDITIRNVLNVFDMEDVYIGIYETMFEPNNIRKISDFMGIIARPDFGSVAINTSVKNSDIALGLKSKIVDYYDPTYRFVSVNFPEVNSVWSGYMG